MKQFIYYPLLDLVLNISMIKAISCTTQTSRAGREIASPYGVVITYEGREKVKVLSTPHKKNITTSYFFTTPNERDKFFQFLVQELT